MLNYLVRQTAEFESNVTCIERIQEYFRIPQEADWELPKAKPPAEWPQKGVIQFQNFYLRYRDDLDHALKDINCTINSQEKVII
jgi:ABC-type multidrug transport system fused ATPase/permease subunit